MEVIYALTMMEIELIRILGVIVLIGCVVGALLLMVADHEEGDEDG